MEYITSTIDPLEMLFEIESLNETLHHRTPLTVDDCAMLDGEMFRENVFAEYLRSEKEVAIEWARVLDERKRAKDYYDSMSCDYTGEVSDF